MILDVVEMEGHWRAQTICRVLAVWGAIAAARPVTYVAACFAAMLHVRSGQGVWRGGGMDE